jgi:hypothetical protein
MARNKHAASRNPPKNGGLPTKTRGAVSPGVAGDARLLPQNWHCLRLTKARTNNPERKSVLMKADDTLVGSVRIHKNAFRLADSRTSKVQQSRYERRKIRVFLRLGEWVAEA